LGGWVVITDVEERLRKDEWLYLIEKYPHVAFNYQNFNGSLNSRERGFRFLYIAEPYIGMPPQWTYDVIKQYDGVITYNSKFYNDYKDRLNMRLVSGCLSCNAYYHLDDFKSYDERIPGACILNRVYNTGKEGDIVMLRVEIADNLDLPVHVWSHVRWGGAKFKGKVPSPIHYGHINHLRKINEYRFCICFESSYHEYWSWDFITERMFNCFKAKTVPIYIGCYNIEQHVPKELFIDFREFYHPRRRDYRKLSQHLVSFPKNQWEDMTEKAFEWNKTNRIGNVEDIETVIGELGG
jgi:hypothetical protein